MGGKVVEGAVLFLKSGARRTTVHLVEAAMYAVMALPRSTTTGILKGAVLRAMGAKVGKRPVFYPMVWIFPGRDLVIGDDVDFATGVLVTTSGGVTIGDRVLLGYGARILSANHRIDGRVPIFAAGHTHAPVRIGSDVWIGAGATVLPGVTVGEGAVVAAGAVVTRSVEAFTVVAGIPAHRVSVRADQSPAAGRYLSDL